MDPQDITPKRVNELVDMYVDELTQQLDLSDYHSFDHLIEGGDMTFEEWKFMRDSYYPSVGLLRE